MQGVIRVAIISLVLCATAAGRAGAQTPVAPRGLERLHVTGALTFSRFEQQVKAEIGGARGERLVTSTAGGLEVTSVWDVARYLSLGLFSRVDAGERTAGRFAALDPQGRTIVAGKVGGSFTEWWLGPLVRVARGPLFADLGYGLVGLRWDEARDDLPDANGATGEALRTSYAVAWRIAAGGQVTLAPGWALTISLQYRIRYYDRRTSGPLANDLVHGTQDFTPFAGVAWTPG